MSTPSDPSPSDDLIGSSLASSTKLPSDASLTSVAYAEDDVKGNLKPTFPHSHLPPRMSQTSATHFQPAQLLDPKRAGSLVKMPASDDVVAISSRNTSTNPQFVFSNSNQDSMDDSDEDTSGANGMTNMIEGMHNVSERQARPLKKLKMDDNDPSAKFSGSKGGYIAEYIKDKRKEPIGVSPNYFEDASTPDLKGEDSNSLGNAGRPADSSVDLDLRGATKQATEIVDLTAGKLTIYKHKTSLISTR